MFTSGTQFDNSRNIFTLKKTCHDHLQYSTVYKSYVGAAIDIYRLSSTSSLDGEGLWELRFRTVEGP